MKLALTQAALFTVRFGWGSGLPSNVRFALRFSAQDLLIGPEIGNAAIQKPHIDGLRRRSEAPIKVPLSPAETIFQINPELLNTLPELEYPPGVHLRRTICSCCTRNTGLPGNSKPPAQFGKILLSFFPFLDESLSSKALLSFQGIRFPPTAQFREPRMDYSKCQRCSQSGPLPSRDR